MLVSLSAYLTLGFYLALFHRSSSQNTRQPLPVHQQPTPLPAVQLNAPNEPEEEEDPNKDFKIAPQSFANIDFENHSYGSYRLSSGKRFNLVLKGGAREYQYPDYERGWFVLDDVYYTDVTGDGAPEAIVRLSHVQCGGGSCDGGAALFYIYALRKDKLQRIWKYETGCLAYGCGLRSFSVRDKRIELEVFGRCPKQATDNPGPRKFVVEDLTQLVFRYNGKRFIRSKLKFVSRPATDVGNYDAQIRIS